MYHCTEDGSKQYSICLFAGDKTLMIFNSVLAPRVPTWYYVSNTRNLVKCTVTVVAIHEEIVVHYL